ncbi:MAG: hypothetical protein AAF787_02745, partial [Chloroflexota bacterium]
PDFETVRSLGAPRPQAMQYNRPLDQFLWVAPGGSLQLVDARTYDVQHTLYTAQTYRAIAFNSTGTLLAVAIDRRVDLWNPITGELLTSFEPDGILDIANPIQFADDDGLLLVNSIVPAPRELRRSENDTVILPWLWDIPNALGTAESQLPNRATAYAFFEYRNGFILGYNDRVIAARPARLELLDVSGDEINVVLAEIDSDRFEPDPVDAWRSLFNEYLYVLPRGRNFTQIDTVDGSVLDRLDRDRMMTNGFPLQIGERMAQTETSLAQFLLGEGYLANNGFSPLHIQLVDILEPITPTATTNQAILYTMDEATTRFSITRITLDVNKYALSADRSKIAFYTLGGDIEVYEIASGNLIQTVRPTYQDFDGRAVFDFDPTGNEIIYDFQRFDVDTGAVILEDLNYNTGFDDFYFDATSNRITTYNYSGEGNTNEFRWWQWDIATGEVVRRENVLLRGDIIATWPTGDRFLTSVSVNQPGQTLRALEIVEIGKNARPQLVFENVPDNTIFNVIPSPDWSQVIVFYRNEFNGETSIALYTFDGGFEWLIPGSELPQSGFGAYWADDETIALPVNGDTPRQATVIYGVDYDATGLPACLVDAFREEYVRWVPVWERRVEGLSANTLHQLSERICEELPAPVQVVDEIITTPTPTRQPAQSARFRATQPVLAGVPECITLRFANEAQRYAEVWRSISAGLSLEDAQELETIICEGITSTGGAGGGAGGFNDGAMLINVNDMRRSFTRDIPLRQREPGVPYSLEVVRAEYERFTEFSRTLSEPKISPDGELIAQRSGLYIEIIRLNRPYAQMAADATATVSLVLSQTPDPVRVALEPTVTPTSEIVGLPRPTVTPTITPTSPPITENIIPLPELNTVTDFCDAARTLFTLENPPEGFSPAGTLYTTITSDEGLWSVNPRTGEFVRDLEIPGCHGQGCNDSYNRNWILYEGERPVITSADGSIIREIVDGENQEFIVASIAWIPNTNVVEYRYENFNDDPFDRDVFTRQYDPQSDFYTDPLPETTPTPVAQINQLNSTNLVALQPVQGRYALFSTSFDTGRGRGNKYYIRDNTTGEDTYFTRLDARNSSNDLRVEWDELGRYLFYRYPDRENWYVFNPQDGQHYIYGEELPVGARSHDGRYRAQWRRPAEEEFAQRSEAGLLNPQLYVWDVDTGGLRRYCIPQTNDVSIEANIDWSPDNRYIAFRYTLPPTFYDDSPTPIPGTTPTPVYGVPNTEPEFQANITRTFILDTETGDVTRISSDIRDILVWVTEGGE